MPNRIDRNVVFKNVKIHTFLTNQLIKRLHFHLY